MTRIDIISFGYRHGQPPDAHLTLDVRHLLRDPHVDPTMRHMTGLDAAVVVNVLRQPGAVQLAERAAGVVRGLAWLTDRVRVAVGCVGGRHRSVVLAECIASELRKDLSVRVEVSHRDVGKPVIRR
jgi:RNase adaptor protein for sRNA GlmZ degradation